MDRFQKRISWIQKLIYITHEVQLLLRHREHSSSPLQRLIGMRYFGTVYSPCILIAVIAPVTELSTHHTGTRSLRIGGKIRRLCAMKDYKHKSIKRFDHNWWSYGTKILLYHSFNVLYFLNVYNLLITNEETTMLTLATWMP